MIGANAQASLDRLLEMGLRTALEPAGGRALDIARGDPPAAAGPASSMVVLMIASHGFRIVTALHFPRTDAVRTHFARLGRMTAGDPSAQAFDDAISESANMCCGAINREIGRFFDYTGMSTPHIIDSRSGPHLDRLTHHHLRHYRIVADDGAVFHASLCAFAHTPMDFVWEPEAAPDTTGELELF